MRYFRVYDTGDDYDPNRWFLDVPGEPSVDQSDPWQFTNGISLSLDGALVTRQRIKGKPQGLSFGAFDIPVVNERVGIALHSVAAPDIQLLPLNVEGLGEPYFVLNVTTVLRCLDESVSVFTKFDTGDEFGREGRYRMVTNLKIEKNNLAGHQIFRIHGWLSPVIVAENIRDLLATFGIPGLSFEQV